MSIIPDPATTDWVPMGFGLGGPLPNQPAARAYRNAAYSVPTSAWTVIPWEGASPNNGNLWSAANPTRLTAPVGGTYFISGFVGFGQGAGTHRLVSIRLNGNAAGELTSGGFVTAAGGGYGGALRQEAGTIVALNAGDYIEAFFYQDSGAAANTTSLDGDPIHMTMALIGGVPGPPGVGIPTPVVNGQWIKGVGGAAVWQPIQQITTKASGNGYAVDWAGAPARLEHWVDATRVNSFPGSFEVYGPYQVTSASFAPGNQGSTTFAHGLGVTPRCVLSSTRDGSWAHAAAYQVTQDATNVTFIMWVPSNAPGSVTQVYNFIIIK